MNKLHTAYWDAVYRSRLFSLRSLSFMLLCFSVGIAAGAWLFR